MNIRSILFPLALAALPAAAERPNILFISIDDFRAQTQAYGNSIMHTPQMDRLAEGGRLFHRHYVQAPTCGASRYALLTGQHPKRGPSFNNGAFDLFQTGHAPVSLPGWFRQNGYYTMQSGKIGHSPDGFRDDKKRIAAEGVPNSYRRAPHLHFSNPQDPEVPGAWDSYETPYSKWKTGWGAFFAYDGGDTRDSGKSPAVEAAPGADTIYPDGLMADTAVAALEKLRDRDEPFFYAVGFYKPHLPFNAPQKYWDLYDRDAIPLDHADLTRASGGEMFSGYSISHADLKDDPAAARELIHGYFASVSYIDAQVGKLLDALDSLGLADNTIVVLWGDHGFHLGELGHWGKHTLHEHSLRSAFMMRVPGMAKPGTATRSIIGSIDIYPTLAELAGLPTPEHLDGKSFASIIKHPEADPLGGSLGFWDKTHTFRNDRHRLIDHPERPQLYDHSTDPGELENIAADHPDKVEEMRGQIRKILDARKAR